MYSVGFVNSEEANKVIPVFSLNEPTSSSSKVSFAEIVSQFPLTDSFLPTIFLISFFLLL